MAKKKKLEDKAKDSIKEMEKKMREESMKKAPKLEKKEPALVDFDTWYFMRSKDIPKMHIKEIIIVDFKARGLKEKETIEAFDSALRKYGVKL